MYAYRIETSVEADGSLTLNKLPFKPGKEVEVIILERTASPKNKSYSLRGQAIQYDHPTEAVAEGDWDVKQ